MTDAWHFVSEDRHTRYEPRVLIVPGQTLTHDGPLSMCKSGFHASVRAIDALKYAPGPIICRVRMSGEIVSGDDKLVAQKRTVLWMADATEALHEMACICATTALLAANVNAPALWAAIEAKRAWRRGEISGAELDAARSAAESAARSAARSAAWIAAESAARSAAGSAAWIAAESAAWIAAESAAEGAARNEQNTVLEDLLNELPHD